MTFYPDMKLYPSVASWHRCSCAWARRLSLCVALGWPLVAAESQTSSSATQTTDDTILLSPFQVDISRDVGFVGASSVAGGRLAGELKDTPAAYSVLTREFIDALGLTSLTEASAWMVNTSSAVTDGKGEVNGQPVALSFRGVGANSLSRNFFRLGVNYDSYNVERYDLARGPNAILFGNGGIGGTANIVTKTATFGRSLENLRISYGSWENIRGAADVNAPLTPRFAVRANVLWQERAGWRDWEMERKNAATLAAGWRPWEGTEVRVEAERGRIVRRNPTFGLNDRFLGWDGVTTFAGSAATLPTDANARGVSRFGSSTSPFFVYAPGLDSSGVINLANTAQTLGGGATTQTPIGGQLIVGTGLQSATWPTLPADATVGLPASRFDRAIAGSKFRIPGASFSTSTNEPTSVQPYETYTATVTQRFGELFLEASGNWATETRRNAYLGYATFNDVYIDINQTMPSGAANPEYLQPYDQITRRQANFYTQPTSIRGAAAYLLNGTRWGDFSFNLSGGVDWSRSTISQYDFVVKRATDHRLWPTQDRVTYRYYWNEVNRPAPTQFDSVSYGGGSYAVGWVNDTTDPALGAVTDTTNPYGQAAAKARLFKGKLHLLTALRGDRYESTTRSTFLPGDYPTDWNGSDYLYRPSAPTDYTALMYTPKDATGKVLGPAIAADSRPRDASGNRLAQYANDRFRDDYSSPDIKASRLTYTLGGVVYLRPWLSAFYNYATSFNPNGSRLRIDGTTFAPQTSAGSDVGLRVTAGQQLSVAISTYRGTQHNEAFDPGTSVATALNNMLNANVVGDLSGGGRNARGLGNVPAQFFDSRDRTNRGYEMEIVANLAPGWRLLLNGSLAKANQTNSYQDFLRYWRTNEGTMRQIVQDAGGLFNADGTASVDSSVAAGQAPDASNAVAGWNSVRSLLANIVSGPQKVSRLVESTGNVFTDYEFQNGWFRHLRVGGGLNYRGREVIGFRGSDTIRSSSNAAAAIDDPNVDGYTPVYGSPYTTGTMTVGYWFKVKRRYRVNLEFKVDNLFNYDSPRYFSTLLRPPGGDVTNPARVSVPGSFYYINPRNVTFTTTLSF